MLKTLLFILAEPPECFVGMRMEDNVSAKDMRYVGKMLVVWKWDKEKDVLSFRRGRERSVIIS